MIAPSRFAEGPPPPPPPPQGGGGRPRAARGGTPPRGLANRQTERPRHQCKEAGRADRDRPRAKGRRGGRRGGGRGALGSPPSARNDRAGPGWGGAPPLFGGSRVGRYPD